MLINGANDTNVPGWLEKTYSPEAVTGVSILVVAACLSFVAAAVMLTAISISSIRISNAFMRTQLGTYFACLILAELVQATGSAMSVRWIVLHKVQSGTFCVTQGLLKNAANVSTALWSTVIAFHTFILIFLRIQVVPWVFYATFVCTWLLIGFIVTLGPTALQNPAKGPFFGVSGYWCWITDKYETEQFTQEYLFMFMAALISIILYSLIFLRLRGNIEGAGFRITLCRARSPWRGDMNMVDPQIERVGKRMLLYPLCYVVLVLPIAACRWSKTYGKPVPFPATIFADTVFLLSGLVNAILYSTTRRVAPIQSLHAPISLRKSGGTVADEKGMRRRSQGCFDAEHPLPPLPPHPTDVEGGYGETQPLCSASHRPQSSVTGSVGSTYSSNSAVSDVLLIGPEFHHPTLPESRTSIPESGMDARSDAPARPAAFTQDWI